MSNEGCVTCRANRGELRAPGGPIYEDELWRLEHVIEPIPIVGWLVLKPLRHVEAIADLTSDEAALLGPLIRRITRAMSEVLQPVKVYLSVYSEAVSHIHVHLIPRSTSIPPDRLGPGMFEFLAEAHRAGRNLADVDAAVAAAAAIRARLEAPEG